MKKRLLVFLVAAVLLSLLSLSAALADIGSANVATYWDSVSQANLFYEPHYGIVTCRNMTIRDRAATSGTSYGSIKNGQPVKILGISGDGNFYMIDLASCGFQNTGAATYVNGEGKSKDEDGNPIYTVSDNDKVYLGEGIPSLTYGLTINLAWKGLDFVLFGTGVAGNEIYNLMVSADRPKTNCLTTYWKDSWGNPAVNNANAKYPDMKQVAQSWDFWSSSACVFNGAFFKIKQIQLGYTFPRALTQKAAISDLRLFVSLDDYITFTKYPGADPETASLNSSTSRGVDSGSYPTTKKLVFGVNLTF